MTVKLLRHTCIFLILFLIPQISCSAQGNGIKISRASFCSDMYDEFSPVYYQKGLIFCSNARIGMTSYSDNQNKGLLDMNYVDTSAGANRRDVSLFSKELSSILNDGPATFSPNRDTVYFSRNQNIDLKISKILGAKNKLGIFSAVLRNGKWTEIKEFRHNIEWYNFTTPCLSSDGHRLFFASDQPGGKGGLDLYYCDLKNGFWDDPVNLGAVVNTDKDEAYPFMNSSYELFFSSEGHSGLGGKDIFVTKQKGSGWYDPERLDAPINSEFDDFGIVTDAMMTHGYFSSIRGKTADIYSFNSDKFNFWFSEPEQENQYCFRVSDTGAIEVDTVRLQYVWDFGDGSTGGGKTTSHCYSLPGKYNIKLDIVDKKTRKAFFNKLIYAVEIPVTEQLVINSSALPDNKNGIIFDCLKSSCPGFQIIKVFWDFGDGLQGDGDKVLHKYSSTGNFLIKMALVLKSESSGNIARRVVSKSVSISNEINSKTPDIIRKVGNVEDIHNKSNIRVSEKFVAEKNLTKESVYQVIIFNSPTRIPLTNQVFRRVPENYTIKEIQNVSPPTYSYIVDQQLDLMRTYPAFTEMISLGFGAKVTIFSITNPAEIQLLNLKKDYSPLCDNYFDPYNRLLTDAYLVLNQIVGLMKKYPEINVEVGVHSDNTGNASIDLKLTQYRAQLMVNHLINAGVSGSRLLAKGYGSSRPVASNFSISERKLNRRIDFVLF